MRRHVFMLALLCAPSLALAQRGSGSAAGRKTELFPKDSMPSGPTLRVRDLEDQSPIKLLIDKHKDLKLTDEQIAKLKESEPKLKEQNKPLLDSVDSLVHELRRSNNGSDEARAHSRDARMALMAAVASVRANYDSASKEAIATLTPDQQGKANELVTKQRADTDKMIRERVGGQR